MRSHQPRAKLLRSPCGKPQTRGRSRERVSPQAGEEEGAKRRTEPGRGAQQPWAAAAGPGRGCPERAGGGSGRQRQAPGGEAPPSHRYLPAPQEPLVPPAHPQNGCSGARPQRTRCGGQRRRLRTPPPQRGSPTPLGSGTKRPPAERAARPARSPPPPRAPGSYQRPSPLRRRGPGSGGQGAPAGPGRPLRAASGGRGPSLTAHGGTARSFALTGTAAPSCRPRSGTGAAAAPWLL